jgi:hypothetical protein
VYPFSAKNGLLCLSELVLLYLAMTLQSMFASSATHQHAPTCLVLAAGSPSSRSVTACCSACACQACMYCSVVTSSDMLLYSHGMNYIICPCRGHLHHHHEQHPGDARQAAGAARAGPQQHVRCSVKHQPDPSLVLRKRRC